MIQKLEKLQIDLLATGQWREKMALLQPPEEAAHHSNPETLLHRDRARLRLRIKLGREVNRE